ncbi:MAG: hypothetical protein JW901_05455 [Dehalococcoidia bacterium]|nr:hypothetical protein [Dehalococcoidia bacterium]
MDNAVGSILGFPWDYKHCAASTLVRTGACVLHAVVINDISLADGVKVTIYDNTEASGDVIAIINIDATKTHFVNPVTLLYDVKCEKGIYASFSADEGDITITYK